MGSCGNKIGIFFTLKVHIYKQWSCYAKAVLFLRSYVSGALPFLKRLVAALVHSNPAATGANQNNRFCVP